MIKMSLGRIRWFSIIDTNLFACIRIRNGSRSTSTPQRPKRRKGFVDLRQEPYDPLPVHQYRVSSATPNATRLYGWGLSSSGALGWKELVISTRYGHTIRQVSTPCRISIPDDGKIFDVACGYGFTLFASSSTHSNYRLRGCGLNTNSQLGFHLLSSSQQRSIRAAGSPAADGGDASPPVTAAKSKQWMMEPVPISLPLKYPDTTKVTHVAAGRVHSVIATDKEGLFALGNNAHGQCGRPVIESESYEHNSIVSSIGLIEDDDNSDDGSGADGSSIKQLVAGLDHTIALTTKGNLYSWGCNTDGQLGHGDFDSKHCPHRIEGELSDRKVSHVSCTGDMVLAATECGRVYGWGNSEYGQLRRATDSVQLSAPRCLDFELDGKAIKVAAAGTMGAVLTDAGTVYVFGYGIVGFGPNVNYCDTAKPLPHPLFGRNEFAPDTKVVDIVAGLYSFAAITDKGELYTWGTNRYYGLGHEHKKPAQYFPLKVILSGDVRKVSVGPDHTFALVRSWI